MQHTHSPFQTRNALKSFVSGKQLVTFRSSCLRNTFMPGTTIHIWRDVRDSPQPSTCISSESHAGASDIDTRHLYQKCSSMRIHDSYLKIVHLLGMLTFKISREFDWLWITGFWDLLNLINSLLILSVSRDLSLNPGLVGSIPPELGQLSSLITL